MTEFKLPVIPSRTYTNQPVRLDGNRYENCKFIDCQIVYSGGPAEVHSCEFSQNTLWDLRNAAAITLQVLQQCGWQIRYGDGEQPTPLKPLSDKTQ